MLFPLFNSLDNFMLRCVCYITRICRHLRFGGSRNTICYFEEHVIFIKIISTGYLTQIDFGCRILCFVCVHFWCHKSEECMCLNLRVQLSDFYPIRGNVKPMLHEQDNIMNLL